MRVVKKVESVDIWGGLRDVWFLGLRAERCRFVPELSCFGQVTDFLSPIFPNCKDHADVPAWVLSGL